MMHAFCDRLLSLLLWVTLSIGMSSQVGVGAPFVNLDFEQAVVVPTQPPLINAEAAFPGWIPRLGQTAISHVGYNYWGIGEAVVALWDQPSDTLLIPLLQGEYMALLVRNPSNGLTASLEQTGDVPADAKSIRMICEIHRQTPDVTINGTAIQMSFFSSIPGSGTKVIYAGDVSAFSGTSATLKLTSRNIEAFDDIQFSSTSIPEPSKPIVSLVALWWLHPYLFRSRTNAKAMGRWNECAAAQNLGRVP